jgi:ABC-type nitrate/sulfonate/bicarbonate transport system permease component
MTDSSSLNVRIATEDPGVSRIPTRDPGAPRVPTPRIPGQPGPLARYEGWLIGAAAVAGFLVVWQFATFRRFVPRAVLAWPVRHRQRVCRLCRVGGDLAGHVDQRTGAHARVRPVGPDRSAVGILMGWYRHFNQALDPFVTFFYSIPRIALTPLLIIWFGIGINSKTAVVLLGAVFAIVINSAAGVRNLDPSLIKAARSFGASDAQVFRTVVIPGSVPFILTGLRLGLGHALTGVVVGELLAARAGVGLMMATAAATFQTSKVFVGLVIVASAGILLTYLLSRIEQRYQSWKPHAS